MTTKEMVRHNVNFLEYPMWFQDKELAETFENGFVWKDLEGYVYRSGYKIPTKTDAIFLLYFLYQCQIGGYTQDLTFTRYQVLKECGLSIDSKWYKRLQESLDRWLRVDISFQGKFYDGKEYQHIAFHIIDAWSIDKKTKALKIHFSPLFLKMMKGKGFFKYINFQEFKSLRSPLATRLYEILSKCFVQRDVWEIDSVKLATKIPMKERYPARIIPKIKTAVNRINENTDAQYELHVRRPERGKAIFSFHKIRKADKKASPNSSRDLRLPDTEEFKALVNMLPERMRGYKTILNMLQKAYNKHGYKYAARNIGYTNRNAKKGYRAYLSKALKEDFGLADEEDRESIHQERKAAMLKIQQDEEAWIREKEQTLKAIKKLSTLKESEQERITTAALDSLDESLVKHIRQREPMWDKILNQAIQKVMSSEESDDSQPDNEL